MLLINELADEVAASTSSAYKTLHAAEHAARYIEITTGSGNDASDAVARAATFAVIAEGKVEAFRRSVTGASATYDEAAACRRVDAYVGMLKAAYQLDEHGVADLAGIDHDVWDENRAGGYDSMTWSFVADLADVTGVPVTWFAPEAVVDGQVV